MDGACSQVGRSGRHPDRHPAPFEGAYQAPWWIEAGSPHAVDDGCAKLWLLDRDWPIGHAITFNARFPAPGAGGAPVDHQPDPWCVGSA